MQGANCGQLGGTIPLGALGDREVQGPQSHPTSGVREVGYLYTHSHQSLVGLLPRVLISHTSCLLCEWMMRILVGGESPWAKMPAGLGWKSAHAPLEVQGVGWGGRVTNSIWHNRFMCSLPTVRRHLAQKIQTSVPGLQLPQATAPLFPSQVAVLSLTPSASQSAAVCPPCLPAPSLTLPAVLPAPHRLQPLAKISGVGGACGHFPALCVHG